MGGTFDPVHYGHLKPAAEVKARLELDKLWLLPNHIPPHKAKATASSEQRLAMLKLACDEFPDMDICDIELKRNAPSYSVATLEALQQAFPGAEFQFIMGTDSLLSLPSWHQWQRLFSLCNLVVCKRPDWHLPKDAEIQTELAQRGCSVTQPWRQESVTMQMAIAVAVALKKHNTAKSSASRSSRSPSPPRPFAAPSLPVTLMPAAPPCPKPCSSI